MRKGVKLIKENQKTLHINFVIPEESKLLRLTSSNHFVRFENGRRTKADKY